MHHRAYQSGWIRTLILTSFAAGLLWLLGPPWLCILFGVETTGVVARDGTSVWYDDTSGQRHTVAMRYTYFKYTRIWGDPIQVQYLRFAPAISWCTQWEDSGKLVLLLVVFMAFVAVPLVLLWWRNILRPDWRPERSIAVTNDLLPRHGL